MRIIVNDIAASNGGALTILKYFYNLAQSDKGRAHTWIFLVSDEYIRESENVSVIKLSVVKKNHLNRLFFDFISGGKYIEELKPDIVISLQNTIIRHINVPQILYVQQSIPFQEVKKFSFFKKEELNYAIYQYIIGYFIKASIKKASYTIVQTKWMKDAVIKQLGVDSDKVMIMLPDVQNSLICKLKPLNSNLFFYPTSDALYKNISVFDKATEYLKATEKADVLSIVTVDASFKYQNLHCVGNMPIEDVFEMYSRSTLVFSSYIETVGLPLIEARNIGALILASDCPFSREVLNEYENAYFFSPFNYIELAKLMSDVMTGKIVRKVVDGNDSYKDNTNYLAFYDMLELFD